MKKIIIRLSTTVFVLQLFMGLFPNIAFGKDIKIITDKIEPFTLPTEIIDNVAYVPVRPLLEALGWKLVWNPVDLTITCSSGKDENIFRINSTNAYINNELIILDDPPVIINGTTYIPSKVAVNQFGTRIRWNKEDNLIIVSNNIVCDIAINGNGNIVVAGNGILVNIIEPYGIDTLYDMLDYADGLLACNLYVDAIAKYKEILKDLSEEENPDIYAQIMNNIGNAYTLYAENRDTLKNILSAIDSYEKALKYYLSKLKDDKTNIARNNLGNAYQLLWMVTGNRKDLQTSIRYYQIAASNSWPETHLLEYASLQFNLGSAYAQSGQEELSIVSFCNAEVIYKDYLKIHSLNDTPLQWAAIHQKLGDIYRILCSISPTKENYLNSIDAYKKCLDVWSVESYPREYARVQKCLGEIEQIAFLTENSGIKIEDIISRFTESLSVYTLERHPVDYAKTNYALGNAYAHMSCNKKQLKYFFKALDSYNEALKVFTKEEYPAYYRKLIILLFMLKSFTKYIL